MTFLNKWTDPNKSVLEYQWPLLGMIEISKFTFLKIELDNYISEIAKA